MEVVIGITEQWGK